MRSAIKRRAYLILLVLCGFSTPIQPQTTPPSEQFVISLPGDFDRFCPNNPVPLIHATLGELITFNVSITAQQDLTLQTVVLLPGGVAATFEEVGASLSPRFPSNVVQAESEVSSTFQWTPSVRRPGIHLFRFLALGTEGPTRFTACEIAVELEDPAMGCLLMAAVDPRDEDAEINFGTVLPGATATREARLEFFASAQLTVGPDEIFICPSGDSRFRDEGIQAFSGNEAFVRLTFSPQRPGQASATVGFYHVADVTGGDPCDTEQNECLQTLDLIGASENADLTVEFRNPVCGDPPKITAILTNRSPFDLLDLSVKVDSPLRVVPVGGFSVDRFSMGGTEFPPIRELLVEFPPDPAEQTGKSLFVSQGAVTALEQLVPIPACIVVQPLLIDFGEVTVNSPAATQTIRLTNPGQEEVTVLGTLEPDDQGFQLTERAVRLLRGSTADIGVGFLPTSAGPKSALLRFESSSSAAVSSVTLVGSATPATSVKLGFLSGDLPLSPGTPFELPVTAVGANASRPFRIVNEGGLAAVDITAAALEDEFEVSPSQPITLVPGESTDYLVTFTPNQSGTSKGILVISGNNFPDQTFLLSGEAFLEPVQMQAWGLDDSVPPRQLDPYPRVGLRLAEPATELLEGTLQIRFVGGPLPPDPSVRFLETGDTVTFRFLPGQTQAEFPNEPDKELVRYQSGTVAGTIRFLVTSLQPSAGAAVSVVGGPEVGSTEVSSLEPRIIDALTCVRTESGVAATLKAYSTIRQINGIDIGLSPAPNTELVFSKPPEDLANDLFTAWFSSSESGAFGGAFAFTIPISVTDIRSLGLISVRLKNEIGWSTVAEISGNSCLR